MILTVTPAPAVDWTLQLDEFSLGQVNRAVTLSREASGKGVNVAWALHRAGIPTTAIFPSGGSTGEFMVETLRRAGLPHIAVPSSVDVRTNITLTIGGRADTKINTSADTATTGDGELLLESVRGALRGVRVLVSCGSLPSGLPPTFHRDVLQLAPPGVLRVLDTTGEALDEGLGSRPHLVKPNADELADICDLDILCLGDVERAARQLIDRGTQAVLASLGADGAMLVTETTSFFGRVAGIQLRNTVGAGDAMLAGFLAGGDNGEEALTTALVWASSAVESSSTLFDVDTRHRDRVDVSADFDRLQPLASRASKGRQLV